MKHELEFYETPAAFTRYLFDYLNFKGIDTYGQLLEPCVGSGAIVRYSHMPSELWTTNDIDERWKADSHYDATDTLTWFDWETDWTITNPPFNYAIEIADLALQHSRVGVAMHLRVSIHEVLKTGRRRTWMREHPPTGILFLPRFAYQRSKKTGTWMTDSASACWCVWLRDKSVPQFIDYAPERVLDALEAETPRYRARMDAIMAERQAAPQGDAA